METAYEGTRIPQLSFEVQLLLTKFAQAADALLLEDVERIGVAVRVSDVVALGADDLAFEAVGTLDVTDHDLHGFAP